jgi:flagellar biosynthesis/type III secretory pathway protein FliH
MNKKIKQLQEEAREELIKKALCSYPKSYSQKEHEKNMYIINECIEEAKDNLIPFLDTLIQQTYNKGKQEGYKQGYIDKGIEEIKKNNK